MAVARRRAAGAIAAVLALLIGLSPAAARPPHLLESDPAAGAIADGRNTEYAVRFDEPVDHEKSRLFITQAGRTVREMQPRLEAAPEVLYAAAPRLPAGDYELHWQVVSLASGDVAAGGVPFTVGR